MSVRSKSQCKEINLIPIFLNKFDSTMLVEFMTNVFDTHPLVIYILLLTKHLSNAEIKLTIRNFGYKKMGECIVENVSGDFDFVFQYIFKSVVDLPSPHDDRLTNFENEYILPHLFVKGDKKQYLLIDFDFCPFNLTFVCRVSVGGFNYSTSMTLNMTNIPTISYRLINENTGKCSNVLPVYAFKFVCIIVKKYIEMGLKVKPSNLVKEYERLYKNIVVENYRIYFKYPSLVLNITCQCWALFQHHPVSLFTVDYFYLPKKNFTNANILPEINNMRDRFSCAVISSFSFIVWSCRFLGTNPMSRNRTKLKYAYLHNLYDSIRVNNSTESLYYNLGVDKINQACTVIDGNMENLRFKTSFLLPKQGTSAMYITPDRPLINKPLECHYRLDVGNLIYFWGCNSHDSNERNTLTMFIQSLRISDNVLDLDYGHLDRNFHCFCQMVYQNLTPLIPETKVDFILPQTEIMLISPMNPNLNDFVTCRTEFRKYINLSWFCLVGGVNISVGDQSNEQYVSRYYFYVLRNIIKISADEIKLHFEFNYESINCACQTIYRSTFAPTQTEWFRLPQTDIPKLVLIPEKFSFNTFIKCNNDFSEFFETGLKCVFYNSEFFYFNNSMDTTSLPDELKYYIRSFTMENNAIFVKLLYLKKDTHCECYQRFKGDPYELNVSIGFTVPNHTNLFKFMDLNCSHPCKYDELSNKMLLQTSDIISPDIWSFSVYQITSAVLHFNRRFPTTTYNRFYPLESVVYPFAAQCTLIEWYLFWRSSDENISQGAWLIMIYKNTTILSNHKPEYISATTSPKFTCFMKLDQGNNTFVVFSINPFDKINLFYVSQGSLQIISNSNFEKEIFIDCSILIYSANIRGWCRLFKLAEITRVVSRSFHRNFSALTYNVQGMDLPVTVLVEMYFPINIVKLDLTGNPDIRFNSTILKNPLGPSVNLIYHAFANNSNGFYQIFFDIQLSVSNDTRYKEFINCGFYASNLNLKLNPSRPVKGYAVTCRSNSLNRLFIFKWFCEIDGSYIQINHNTSNYDPDIYNKYRNLLDNLFVGENPQSLRFEYLLKPDFYYCMCLIESYPVFGKVVNKSRTFDFKVEVYEFLYFQKNYDNKLKALFFISAFLWKLVMVLIFLILTLNDHHRKRHNLLIDHLFQLTGFYKVMSSSKQKNNHKTYHIMGAKEKLMSMFKIKQKTKISVRKRKTKESGSVIFEETNQGLPHLLNEAYEKRRKSLIGILKTKEKTSVVTERIPTVKVSVNERNVPVKKKRNLSKKKFIHVKKLAEKKTAERKPLNVTVAEKPFVKSIDNELRKFIKLPMTELEMRLHEMHDSTISTKSIYSSLYDKYNTNLS